MLDVKHKTHKLEDIDTQIEKYLSLSGILRVRRLGSRLWGLCLCEFSLLSFGTVFDGR